MPERPRSVHSVAVPRYRRFQMRLFQIRCLMRIASAWRMSQATMRSPTAFSCGVGRVPALSEMMMSRARLVGCSVPVVEVEETAAVEPELAVVVLFLLEIVLEVLHAGQDVPGQDAQEAQAGYEDGDGDLHCDHSGKLTPERSAATAPAEPARMDMPPEVLTAHCAPWTGS